MVKSGRCPSRFSVASGAIGRKLSSCVVRVNGRVIIWRMATRASVRRVIVVAVVASRAIARNARMRPV